MSSDHQAFATPADLRAWLAAHHDTRSELWVRIYKKQSGTASVTWDDCVIESLCWGWIDGQKKPLDDQAFLQRLTPRRSRSGWSQKNRDHVERLIAEGRMQPPGLAQVRAAQADGRWETAYARSSEMVIPDDFLAALDQDPEAKAAFAGLNRASLFMIYYRLHSAKRPETRARRMADFIGKLHRGEALA